MNLPPPKGLNRRHHGLIAAVICVICGSSWAQSGEIDAREARIRQALAAALIQETEYARAFVHLDALLEAGYDTWSLHLNMAQVCLYWSVDYECAEAHATRARALRPDNPRVHLLLGQIAQDTGRVDEAIDFYRRGLELRPGEATISILLAGLLERQGNRDGALEVLETARRQSPENGRVMLHLARLIEDEDPAYAESLYLSAAQHHEDPAVSYRHLVRFYERQGKTDDADRIREEIEQLVGRRQMRVLR